MPGPGPGDKPIPKLIEAWFTAASSRKAGLIRGTTSDEEWAVFAPFVADNRARGGRLPRNHRRALDGIFWIARTGAPPRDLPAEFGGWNSVYQQLRRWTSSGIRDLILVALAEAEPDAAAPLVS